MNEISSWLISIIGVVIIGVLVDLILPNGKLNGFIKAIFGFFTIIVIISPFPKLFNMNFSFNDIFYNNQSCEIDKDYVDATNKRIVLALEENLVLALEKAGFSNLTVEIEYNLENYSYIIKNVFVNIKNLVINQNVPHINKYTEMSEVIMDNLNVPKEMIIFNEW